MTNDSPTPASLGYCFPAEWEPHEATWFSWPRPEGISFPRKYHRVPANLAAIYRVVAEREIVRVNVPNENYERIVREQLRAHGCPLKSIEFFHIKTNESWCRDHGPAFVARPGKIAVVDWGFNAWGGKYPPWDDDDAVPTRIAKALSIRKVFNPGIVMEGGAVDFNGAGTVLTTTDCLLNKNRNPSLSRDQIEQYLKDYYGQKHVCWLTGGIEGDDTDGHIDDLARFISPTTLVMGIEADASDANYKVLRRVRKQIEKLRDQDGRPFDVVELPMPRPVTHEGERLPATYGNFSFVNGGLIVPTYRDRKNDARALAILREALPGRDVIGVDCVELIWGLGAVHCLSQQQPAVR